MSEVLQFKGYGTTDIKYGSLFHEICSCLESIIVWDLLLFMVDYYYRNISPVTNFLL